MNPVRSAFRSLRVRNFRLYFIGQAISFSGTWMQRLAQEWLVLELTGSGSWLGITAALQFLPILVLAPWGGVIVDRMDKRKLILWCHVVAGALALTLGLLVAFDVVTLWMVCALALGLGIVTALDNPARQSFTIDMVGPDDVQNAVTLNSIVVNSARAVGPAIAGALIVTSGMAVTFMLNAASYVAVVVALLAMDTAALRGGVRAPKGPGQLMEGLRHVWRTPVLRAVVILMAVSSMFAWEFAVTLPLLARFTFHGDAGTLGAMNGAFGVGAVVGGLLMAGRGRPDTRALIVRGLLFGGLLLVTSAAPSLNWALAGLLVTGAVSIQFLSLANGLLHLHSGDAFRGRVMSLWSVAIFGMAPFGAPLIGWISEVSGPRAGLGAGGLATVLVATWVGWSLRRVQGLSVTRPTMEAT